MKTLLCVIAAIAFLALPVLAEDVKVDFKGSRLAAGYMDTGSVGNTNPGTFGVPDAKLRFNAALDADTTAVMRLNFSNTTAGGADYAYVKLTNAIKKLAKSDMVNPDIYVGRLKINIGEETWTDNPVESALANNAIGGFGGTDMGIEFRQKELPVNLPVVLGYAVGFGNGQTGAADANNGKAYNLKAMATMKSMPLYFSLSQYDSGRLAAAATPAVSSDLLDTFIATFGPLPAGMYTKVYELDVRYDMLEGAQKFDPTKAPLFSDAKGVFRLAYASGAKGPMNLMTETTTMMLDGVYNVDKQWFVAFRYSSLDNTVDTWTRMSVGGGHRLSDNTMLKLDYTTNTEPDSITGGPEVDNNSVSLLMTVKW